MSYTPMQLHLEVVDEYDEGGIEEDAISMLSEPAPHPAYIAYRPADNTPTSSINLSPTLELPPVLTSPTRIPTPPKLLPIVWPGVFPSRSTSSATPSRTPSRVPSRKPSPLSRQVVNLQSQFSTHNQSHALIKTPSQSLSLRLFNFNVPAIDTQIDTRSPSQPSPWTNTTHCHAASGGAHEHTDLLDAIHSPPLKERYVRNPRHLREPWQTGAMLRFPWKGLGALFFVLILTGACIAIILVANNTSISSWSYVQPATYLCILELSLILFTLAALSDGMVITFWTSLLAGCTVASLHDSHEATTPWIALRQLIRLHPNRPGTAALMSMLSLIRGPFFQRSLTPDITKATATYTVDPVFAALGIIFSLACIIAILPLYSGFWLLGRRVSLSPLEIARAFGAPVFEGLDGNAAAGDVDMVRGEVVLRYGVVERGGGGMGGVERALRVVDKERGGARGLGEGEVYW